MFGPRASCSHEASARLRAGRAPRDGRQVDRRDLSRPRILRLSCRDPTAPGTAETLQLPLCARVLEEARHTRGHGRLKHLDGRSAPAMNQMKLTCIEIGLTVPLALRVRI